MRKVSGLALVAIGLLHSLALVMPGALGFSGIWKEIGDAGVVDVVRGNQHDRGITTRAKTAWRRNFIIIMGIAGALLACVADSLSIGQPVSGAEMRRLGLNAMLGVSQQRLLLGGAMGAFAFFLQACGFYAVYRGLAPANRWLAHGCLALFVLALFIGTAWHASYPFLGAALQYEQAAEPPAFPAFYSQLVFYLVTAYYCWRYAMLGASVLLAVAVLFQPTHFPGWYAVFVPYTGVYLGSLLLPLVPAPLGGYLAVSGVNLPMLVFFAATGALLWNLKQG